MRLTGISHSATSPGNGNCELNPVDRIGKNRTPGNHGRRSPALPLHAEEDPRQKYDATPLSVSGKNFLKAAKGMVGDISADA